MTESTPTESEPLPPRTILVVDDERELRQCVQDILEEEGFHVAAARNGAEALAYLRASPPPALVLLDLSMPVMDGATFRQEQQKDARLASIPVVVFSAAAGLAEKVRSMNVAGYLAKPMTFEQLVAIARRFCGGQAPT